MDYVCADVTKVPGAQVGDTTTLLGREGDQVVSVEELASLADTIPYEIFCGIGRRVRRVYQQKGSGAVRAPEPTE